MLETFAKAEFNHTLSITEQRQERTNTCSFSQHQTQEVPKEITKKSFQKKAEEVLLQIVPNYVVEFFLEDIKCSKEEKKNALRMRDSLQLRKFSAGVERSWGVGGGMGCTCPSPGDEVRGEFVFSRGRVPRMELQYQFPPSQWLFSYCQRSKYFLQELLDTKSYKTCSSNLMWITVWA